MGNILVRDFDLFFGIDGFGISNFVCPYAHFSMSMSYTPFFTSKNADNDNNDQGIDCVCFYVFFMCFLCGAAIVVGFQSSWFKSEGTTGRWIPLIVTFYFLWGFQVVKFLYNFLVEQVGPVCRLSMLMLLTASCF